jgi:bacillithiol biosynthesis deacetylase BshB1
MAAAESGVFSRSVGPGKGQNRPIAVRCPAAGAVGERGRPQEAKTADAASPHLVFDWQRAQPAHASRSEKLMNPTDSSSSGTSTEAEPATPLDVLVIAPHPDDAEIGAGGTIVRSVRNGLRVGILDLTSGEPTPHGSPEIRSAETVAATRALGVCWRRNLGLPNRSLENTLEARRSLAGALRTVRPRILLLPYWDDSHPDHVVASRLADDARFWSKLTRSDMPGEPYWPPRAYYYWSIHLRIHPRPAFVVDISDCIDAKLESLRAYRSQFVEGRSQEFPTALDDIRDRARYWGWSIGKAYGEPFASREGIGLPGLEGLL